MPRRSGSHCGSSAPGRHRRSRSRRRATTSRAWTDVVTRQATIPSSSTCGIDVLARRSIEAMTLATPGRLEGVRFDGDDDPVARDERRERQVAEHRRRVDEHEVPVARQPDERSDDRQPGLVAAVLARRDEARTRRHELDAGRRRVDDQIARGARHRSSIRRARSPSSAPPSHSVAEPCGSRSTTRTRRPRSRECAARLTVVVVLPLPPLLFVTVMTRTQRSPSTRRIRPSKKSSATDAAPGGVRRSDFGAVSPGCRRLRRPGIPSAAVSGGGSADAAAGRAGSPSATAPDRRRAGRRRDRRLVRPVDPRQGIGLQGERAPATGVLDDRLATRLGSRGGTSMLDRKAARSASANEMGSFVARAAGPLARLPRGVPVRMEPGDQARSGVVGLGAASPIPPSAHACGRGDNQR